MKLLVLGLTLAALACGGDSDEGDPDPMQMELQMQEREGPVGCYLPARMMCDCALTEQQCTGEDKVWTPGCMSCEM